MIPAATRERFDHTRREYLATVRGRAQARRLDHRRAEDVAGLDRHVAEADADAERDRNVGFDEALPTMSVNSTGNVSSAP